MRVLRTTGLSALLLASAAACADLSVPNNNQPDQSRVVADAGDVETLVANSYLTLFYGYTWQTDLVLSVAAFQHSAMAANLGMIQFSKIPREPIGNTTSDAYRNTNQEIWYNSYGAIKAAVDGLQATDPANPDGFSIIDPATGADNTPRARAWARFVQGLGHGLIALTYDQGFVYDTDSDPTALEFQPYGEVMAEALSMLDEAASIAASNNFNIPPSWFGNVGMDRAGFVKMVNGYQAYLRASVARTPAERAAVDWGAVIADVDASYGCSGAVCDDLFIAADANIWIHGTHLFVGFGSFVGAWAQMFYQIHGMADQSGKYQEWLSLPVLSRHPLQLPSGPFLIQTPDLRFPQGADAGEQVDNPGVYIIYGGARAHVRSDRGTWRWSLYRDARNDDMLGDEGESIMLSGRDLRLLKAEGLYRQGNRAGAAAIINETRVNIGGLNATDAGGTNTSCVPKLPTGACGDLWEMLKWEKRMENYEYGYGVWFFDSRGWGDLYKGTPIHFPVPARELQVLGLPLYTFGGTGDGAAPCSSYNWKFEC